MAVILSLDEAFGNTAGASDDFGTTCDLRTGSVQALLIPDATGWSSTSPVDRTAPLL